MDAFTNFPYKMDVRHVKNGSLMEKPKPFYMGNHQRFLIDYFTFLVICLITKSAVLHTLILIITSHAYACFVIYMLQHHGELLKSAAPHSPILIITIIVVAFGTNSFFRRGPSGGEGCCRQYK